MGTVPGSMAYALATNTVGKLAGLILYALGAVQRVDLTDIDRLGTRDHRRRREGHRIGREARALLHA